MGRELVIMVPTQVKRNLNMGNIYEFILGDFYTKVKHMKGEEADLAITWNANGKPVEELVIREMEGAFSREKAHHLVDSMIESANKVMSNFYIEPDIQLRDDDIQIEVEKLMNNRYSEYYTSGNCKVVICPSCQSAIGSDESVNRCNHCGTPTVIKNMDTLYRRVLRSDVETKMMNTSFYPEGCKKRLDELLNNLPDDYNVILEKKRLYTLRYGEYSLDPRFVTIFSLPVIKHKKEIEYDEITVIQGDVVKKYDYYAYTYLHPSDCPNNIFMHGLILDENKKKLRWRSDESRNISTDGIYPGVKCKEFRAFLLKHNLTDNIIINPNTIKNDVKGQVNLYITMKRLMDSRNLDVEKIGIRKELDLLHKSFLDKASAMRMHDAYMDMKNFVDNCWKLTKNDKMSKEEQDIISCYMRLYYGE